MFLILRDILIVDGVVPLHVCQGLCGAVRCSAVQCVAACCKVLQCVAVRCSALQCVAVCCSVLQRDTLIVSGGVPLYVCQDLCGAVRCSVL